MPQARRGTWRASTRTRARLRGGGSAEAAGVERKVPAERGGRQTAHALHATACVVMCHAAHTVKERVDKLRVGVHRALVAAKGEGHPRGVRKGRLEAPLERRANRTVRRAGHEAKPRPRCERGRVDCIGARGIGHSGATSSCHCLGQLGTHLLHTCQWQASPRVWVQLQQRLVHLPRRERRLLLPELSDSGAELRLVVFRHTSDKVLRTPQAALLGTRAARDADAGVCKFSISQVI